MTHIHGSGHVGHGLFAGLITSLGLGPAFDHWHHTHHGFWDPFIGWLWNENSTFEDLHHNANGLGLWSLPTSHHDVELASFSTPMATPDVTVQSAGFDLTAVPIGFGYTVGVLFLLAFVAVVLIGATMLTRRFVVAAADRRFAAAAPDQADDVPDLASTA